MMHLIVTLHGSNGQVCACGEVVPFRSDGIKRCTYDLYDVNCPACIDKWETEPMPVKTDDLAKVTLVLCRLAHVLAKHTDGLATTIAELNVLHAQLVRPRRKPRLETTP